MTRPSRLHVLMETASAWAERGTCSRLKVGAVVHREGRILVNGYNGTPRGLEHCDHACDCTRLGPRVTEHAPNCNAVRPCETAQHAERNCIDWAARWGIALAGAEMVTTDSPCSQCAGSIINSGIISVISFREYRDTRGLDMLRDAGVEVARYEDVI